MMKLKKLEFDKTTAVESGTDEGRRAEGEDNDGLICDGGEEEVDIIGDAVGEDKGESRSNIFSVCTKSDNKIYFSLLLFHTIFQLKTLTLFRQKLVILVVALNKTIKSFRHF